MRIPDYHIHSNYSPDASMRQKDAAEETVQVIQSQKFDYVLLSTHCVDGLDCGRPESKRGREKAEAYRRYLETVYESVTDSRLANAYDCVGHVLPHPSIISRYYELGGRIITTGSDAHRPEQVGAH